MLLAYAHNALTGAGSECKDLERNGQTGYRVRGRLHSDPKRAGSRSLTFSPCFLRAD